MRPTQESDVLPTRFVVITTIAVIAVTAFGVGSAWLIERARHDSLGGQPYTGNAELDPPAEINAMEMQLFDESAQRTSVAETVRRDLDSYGWVDRDGGIVHIPVDRAIELYLQRSETQVGP